MRKTNPMTQNAVDVSHCEAKAAFFMCGSNIDSMKLTPAKQTRLSRNGKRIAGD